jgi:uncharacterized membrane protein required for colicin V production
MNILTIIVLLIIGVFALNGWKKGFVRVFTHMFFFLASAVLVYFATPYISGFLKDYTPVYSMVEESCKTALESSVEEGLEEDPDSAESKLDQKKYIEELGLPEILEKQLVSNNNDSSYEGMAISAFADYIAGYMANLILNLMTFVITLIVVHLILRMTILTLKNLSKLPVLHSVDQTLGMVLGLAEGLLLVWIGFLLITACSNTDIGKQLLEMIHESPVLEFLYNTNIFLSFLLQIVAEMLL